MMALFNARDNGDDSITLTSGQRIEGFHKASQCLLEYCPVHHPSAHPFGLLKLGFDGVHMIRLSETFKPLGYTIDPDDYLFNRDGHAILRNSAKCLICGQEVVSEYRHDFESCACGNVFVDGGLEYIRHGVKDASEYVNTSVVIDKDEEKQ